MAKVIRYTRSVSIPIRMAASRSWAVARITRPVCVHFMKAKSGTVSAMAMTNATTCERLKAVPATRIPRTGVPGPHVAEVTGHGTSATFCSAVDSPTVVKICTLCEAWMTPRMTST